MSAVWIGISTLILLGAIMQVDDINHLAVDVVDVFIAALLLYILTLAPSVLPADAGEFQLVAATLGVAHPPGYPLIHDTRKAIHSADAG